MLNSINEISDFKKFHNNITKQNILKEVIYFDDVHNNTFKRAYGWIWLFKLPKILHNSIVSETKLMCQNLEQLVELIELKYIQLE